jgi:hypothetical protein
MVQTDYTFSICSEDEHESITCLGVVGGGRTKAPDVLQALWSDQSDQI